MNCNEKEKKALLEDLSALTQQELESIRHIVHQLAEDHRQEEEQEI